MRSLCLACVALVAACSSKDATPTETPPPAPKPPYELTVLDAVRIGSKSEEPNFQNARAPVTLKDGPFEKVTLTVQLATTCYPFESWADNRPPAGQNWPADCDAFDRNFETSLEESETSTTPALELVRAITPFGGPLTIEKDVTDVYNALHAMKATRSLHVHITSWSDGEGKVSGSNGGWNVTAKLSVTPGTPPRKVLAVTPLIHKSVGPMDSTQKLPFEIPAGTTNARVEYRVTGHGGADGASTGCTQPADEFCRREHVLTIDGAPLATVTPWRSDCRTLCTLAKTANGQDYCQQNPCGAIASVRASRANWCPGSETPPLTYEPPVLLVPGKHELGFAIGKVAEGGSWRVSASVFAYE